MMVFVVVHHAPRPIALSSPQALIASQPQKPPPQVPSSLRVPFFHVPSTVDVVENA